MTLPTTAPWLHVLVCMYVAVACRYIIRVPCSTDRNANSHVIGWIFVLHLSPSKRLSARAQLVGCANSLTFQILAAIYACNVCIRLLCMCIRVSGILGCNLAMFRGGDDFNRSMRSCIAVRSLEMRFRSGNTNTLNWFRVKSKVLRFKVKLPVLSETKKKKKKKSNNSYAR